MSDSTWPDIREAALERDNHQCQKCGNQVGTQSSKQPTAHVHHIKPRNEGGSDELDNLETLCRECHAEKHQHSGVGGDVYRRPIFSKQSETAWDPNPTDEEILDLLGHGRETTGSLAQQLDKHPNYIRDRLRLMRIHGLVQYHHEETALHELVRDPRDKEDNE